MIEEKHYHEWGAKQCHWFSLITKSPTLRRMLEIRGWAPDLYEELVKEDISLIREEVEE